MRITLSCYCGATIEAEWDDEREPRRTGCITNFEERHADCRPPNLAPNDPTPRTGDTGLPAATTGAPSAETPGQGAKQ